MNTIKTMWKKLIHSNIGAAMLNMAVAYLVWMLSRVGFFVENWSSFAPYMSWSLFWSMLRGALVFDTSALLYVNSLYLVLMLLIVALYVAVSADLGLMMNLLKPNLNWTNETVPVKQGLPVVVCLFGGWFLSILCVGLCAALGNVVDVRLGMAAEAVLLGILLLLMQRWLQRKGCRIFEEL